MLPLQGERRRVWEGGRGIDGEGGVKRGREMRVKCRVREGARGEWGSEGEGGGRRSGGTGERAREGEGAGDEK